MQALQELQLLTIAEGEVDPAARIATGEISEAKIITLAEQLQTDEFYGQIPEGSIACVCMDCRPRQDGKQELGGNAAGGSYTLVIADALTHNSYRRKGEDSAEHTKRMYTELKKEGYRVGGHDADSASGSNCGCGAEDKLDSNNELAPSILRYAVNRADDVRATIESFGFEVSDELHDTIVSNAAELRANTYAASGAEVRQATIEAAGYESVETLAGAQHGVLAVINTREGQTLNRQKVAKQYGSDYQVFNIDVPAIIAGTRAISISETEATEKTIAALYYNVAAAAVIAGPSMPIVVR